MLYSKRISIVLAAVALFLLCSCNKEEWTNYFGFQKQDLVGTYSNSGVEGAFDSFVEGSCCHICRDADIKVDLSESGILTVDFLSPRHGFDHSFSGIGVHNDHDFLIEIPSGSYDFTARVKTDDANRIRLVGHARRYYANFHVSDTVYHDVYVNYVFDVIKN